LRIIAAIRSIVLRGMGDSPAELRRAESKGTSSERPHSHRKLEPAWDAETGCVAPHSHGTE
jgi:hypothetical protein